MSFQERAFAEAMEQLGVAKAARRALLNEIVSILLAEQDKMFRSFRAKQEENGST